MQSEILLLSSVKHEKIASLVQREFELLGVTNIKGVRIDAERQAIHKAVAQAIADYNVIMIIGGMGEGENNITPAAVAAAVGFPTVSKDGEVFPEGAEIFRNKKGKPSGCAIAQGNQCIIMLPGDKESFQFMLCYRVTKYLADFIGRPYYLKTLRADGIAKDKAEEALRGQNTFGAAVQVFEDGGETAVQIYASGANGAEAKERGSAAMKNAISALGSSVYAVDAENVGQAFARELAKKGLKTAIAVEGVQKLEIMGAAFTSEYIDNYLGTSQGVEKYEIPEKLLRRHGANSDWTAAVLAGEVNKHYGANIGIAVTMDVERPGDGANVAVCMGDNVWTERVFADGRDELVAAAGKRAIHLARAVASAYPKVYGNAVSLMGAVSGKTKFATGSTERKQKWYSRFIPMKGDSAGELIRKTIFILCVLVFLGCMGYLSTKLFDSINHRSLAANLQGLLNENIETPDDWEFLDKFYDLYRENEDLIGYIQIEGTNVNFPVVQTTEPGKDGSKGQYYLRRDYYGNNSMYGTPFLDYRCNAYPDYRSTNLIIYGHNVYDDGKMFSDLNKYRKLSFYKEHPVIQFDSLYEENKWLVIGVVLTNAYSKDGPIWDYNNFINGDEAETQEFINEVAKRTMVVTGVDYNAKDSFLTLSTCCYDFTDARVVIIARRVRDGEDISNLDTSKAYYNSNPLMPDKWYAAISQAQKSDADAAFGDAEDVSSSSESSAEGEVTGIEIIRKPEKLTYKVGERLDTYGMVLRVYRTDESGNESYEDIYEDFEVYPGGKFDAEGEIEITVYYDEFAATFTVRVEGTSESSSSSSESSSSEVKITGVKIARKPDKLTYTVGEKLDTAGLALTVTKSDGSTETVTTGFEVKPKDAFETEGQKEITVYYKDFTAYFTVEIKTASSSESSEPPSSESSEETSSDSSLIDISESESQSESQSQSESGNTTPPIEGSSVSIKRPANKAPASVVSVGGSYSPYYEDSLIDTVIINGTTMSVYDAVCQIVAYEAGKGQPDEHVKAQAVATYTYVMYNGGRISAGTSTAKLDSQIKRCVAEVIGYAVLDNRSDDYILATYFSESCGATAAAEWVWGYPNRNLLSVSSPVDGFTPTTYRISSTDFAKKVKSNANIDLSGDPSNWIKIVSYWGDTPYVNKITLGGTSYTGRKLRETVLGGANLRSTAFSVEYDSGSREFVFTMYGYGHGVGMSAVGSIAYAKQGYSWDEILLKYYSNCYIDYKY